MSRGALASLGILAGGLVHSLIPRRAFGAYDRVARPAIVGLVSGAAAALIYILVE